MEFSHGTIFCLFLISILYSITDPILHLNNSKSLIYYTTWHTLIICFWQRHQFQDLAVLVLPTSWHLRILLSEKNTYLNYKGYKGYVEAIFQGFCSRVKKFRELSRFWVKKYDRLVDGDSFMIDISILVLHVSLLCMQMGGIETIVHPWDLARSISLPDNT